MNTEQWDLVLAEAEKLFYRYTHCVRGQTITEKDCLEYWTAHVAWEHAQRKSNQ